MGTQSGVGFSNHRNPKVAGQEAVKSALQQAGMVKPDFVFLFATAAYPQQALLDSVRAATDYAPLCGCSGEGIIAHNLADESNFAVAVMVIQSDEMHLKNGFNQGLKANPTQIGSTMGAAIKPQLREDAVGIFLFADGLTFNFERFVTGLETSLELTHSLPMLGGVSADSWDYKQTYQYCDDHVISDGAVWALLSGEVKLAWAVSHGCIPLGGKRIITRAEGNVIYEIDHQPVLDVLKEYLMADEIDKWQTAIINLCLGFKTPGHMQDYDEFFIRFIPGKDDATGAVTIQTEAKTGDAIWMTRRDQVKISAGLHRMGESITHQLSGNPPKLVFQFDCAGRGKIFFREEQKLELVKSLQQQVAPQTPWIGLYTFGEIGPVSSGVISDTKFQNCFHNYTAVLAAIY
jgi:hypothetical protein